jgi:hypothetical protein
MRTVDAQTAITMLENRLLKTEGQILAIQFVLQSLVTADDALSGPLRQHLAGTKDVFERFIGEAPDDATRRTFVAGRDFMVDLVSERTTAPTLTIVRGGKQED